MNVIEKTNLKPINPETLNIKKLSTEEDTFLVELPLDGTPQEDWQELFEKELKKTAQPLAILKKPNDSFPMFETNYPKNLQGDTISIITNPKKLQEDIKLVMQLVETVNDRVDRHNKEVNEQNEKENLKNEKDKETISEMRESLKKNASTV
jgi:organic radical activating enzyme